LRGLFDTLGHHGSALVYIVSSLPQNSHIGWDTHQKVLEERQAPEKLQKEAKISFNLVWGSRVVMVIFIKGHASERQSFSSKRVTQGRKKGLQIPQSLASLNFIYSLS
jgi:hypothetical protein